MFSPKQSLRWLAVSAMVALSPAACWGQVKEMQRGQLVGPDNASFGKVVFSPDGKLMAAGSFMSSTISVFDIATMKEKVRLQLPDKNYDYHLAFSADCRTLYSAGREDAM